MAASDLPAPEITKADPNRFICPVCGNESFTQDGSIYSCASGMCNGAMQWRSFVWKDVSPCTSPDAPFIPTFPKRAEI